MRRNDVQNIGANPIAKFRHDDASLCLDFCNDRIRSVLNHAAVGLPGLEKQTLLGLNILIRIQNDDLRRRIIRFECESDLANTLIGPGWTAVRCTRD